MLASLAAGMPTLPQSVLEWDGLLRGNPVNLERVTALVARDPNLAAQVLSLCDPEQGTSLAPLANLREAVARLGPERLRTLMLTCSLLQADDGESAAEHVPSLWHHSALTARLSQRIARRIGYPVPEKSYLAGMLHDIGYIALLEHLSPDHPVGDAGLGEGGDLLEAEREQLGIDHCAAGTWLGFCWNFAPELVDVLEHHHHPQDATHDPQLVAIVAVADRYCRRHGITVGIDAGLLPLTSRHSDQELLRPLSSWLTSAKRAAVVEDLEDELLAYVRSAGSGAGNRSRALDGSVRAVKPQ